MRNRMTAVLIVMMMSFAAGNASAMMGGGRGMMDCKDKCGAEKGMMMKGEGMGGRFMMMVDMLELNDGQQKAVEAIHSTHRKEVIRKEADIEVAEIELQEIMGKEPVNLEDAEMQIRAIAALHADLDIMHLKAKEAVKAKLTPEQLEKMKNHLAADMREKMEEMKGMGMMAGKSRKHHMMGDDSGGAKASDADAADKDEDSPEHSGHH